jgi:flagellar hook-basal body complex protein FliE
MDISAYGMSPTSLARQVMRQARLSSAASGAAAQPAVARKAALAKAVASDQSARVGGVQQDGGFSVGRLDQGDGQVARGEGNKSIEPTGPTFQEIIDRVVKLDNDAQKAIDGYAKGEHNNLHETMLALSKADVTLNLMVTVRNKLLQAYQQVMKMS